MRLTLVAALDEAMAIGLQGAMPWHLPADLRRFRQLTTGHTVLMGRLTWESIGRPLPHRRNVVVTRSPDRALPDGVEVFASLDAALDALRDTPQVFVIGGAQLYAATLPIAPRMVLTVIHTRVERADTFFPAFDLGAWDVVAAEHFDADDRNPWPQTVFDLHRRDPAGPADPCVPGRLSSSLKASRIP